MAARALATDRAINSHALTFAAQIPRPAPGKTPSATSWALFLSGTGFRRWAIVYHLCIIVRVRIRRESRLL